MANGGGGQGAQAGMGTAAGVGARAGNTRDNTEDLASITGVRHAWERYPQCSLYNGVGGPDGGNAIAVGIDG
jgi:hypothetical protein